MGYINPPLYMIRKFRTSDLDAVLHIWQESNMQAHSFISASYWAGFLPYMRQILPQSDVVIYETNQEIIAFAGLEKDYIAGIFVRADYRSMGIGREMLDYLKQRYPKLSLCVYEKNQRATDFYRREGFEIVESRMDKDTYEVEYVMQWNSHDE